VGWVRPDMDVLVSFDKGEEDMVLLVIRDSFRKSGRANFGDNEISGWLTLAKILRCRLNLCWEGAVRNFHPETYKKTLSAHK
jgi:hypothetical protein